VQPCTLKVFEAVGVLPRILDAAIQMHGRIVYVNGETVAQVEFANPPTGTQGMKTGFQDVHNLAWKLALAVSGRAAPIPPTPTLLAG
jgi:2-polyprenyl-6-methoxyphenol hydroxylase-like FAD-dependent oxidoreductase